MGLLPGQSPPETAESILKKVYEPVRNSSNGFPNSQPPYNIEYGNWYKTIPYGFRICTTPATEYPKSLKSAASAISKAITKSGDDVDLSFFFPVNPESINISTPFAVQVTPTLGGIVEEHSGAVFYNITISGTTGVIPEIDPLTGIPRSPNELRSMASGDGLIPSNALGGFGASTINAINSVVSKFTGVDSKLVDGTRNQVSGYTAFHVLYKFIWLYHYGKANGAGYELRFVNYKDNNQYNIVVQNFQLSRDKSRPHLYQYTIQMKGWKLDNNSVNKSFTKDPKKRLEELGLGEGPSFKAKLFRVINTTKSTLNAAAGLLNTAAQDLVF